MLVLFAVQQAELWLGIVIVGMLFGGLLVPYLFEEIWRGKVEVGPNFPTGAGDTHPGYRGDLTAADPRAQAAMHDADATLSLRAFHMFLISLSVVLTSGCGIWGFFNNHVAFGVLSLAFGLLLIVYGCYFVWKAESAILA